MRPSATRPAAPSLPRQPLGDAQLMRAPDPAVARRAALGSWEERSPKLVVGLVGDCIQLPQTADYFSEQRRRHIHDGRLPARHEQGQISRK